MFHQDRFAHKVQERAAGWAEHAKDDPSAAAASALKWTLSRLDEARVPPAVHGFVGTVTGNKKAVRQAQKAAVKAAYRKANELKRSYRRTGKAWLIAGTVGTVVVGGVLLWRALRPQGESGVAQKAGAAPVVDNATSHARQVAEEVRSAAAHVGAEVKAAASEAGADVHEHAAQMVSEVKSGLDAVVDETKAAARDISAHAGRAGKTVIETDEDIPEVFY